MELTTLNKLEVGDKILWKRSYDKWVGVIMGVLYFMEWERVRKMHSPISINQRKVMGEDYVESVCVNLYKKKRWK